ncbi:MAG: L,D-transpeptidase family protein [Candidatus Hydrogenedentes bacterium]|nr:L,D-transpeptidase family protein [Candidatus Hydrogenedentota bacterium]
MVTQYSAHRNNDSGLSRTILRLAILFAVAFAVFQGYPYLRAQWDQWRGNAASETPIEAARNKIHMGDEPAAAAILDQAIAREQRSEPLYRLLLERTRLAQVAGDWPLASELLKRALAAYPASPDYPAVLAQYGAALEKQERFEEARKQYEEVLRTAPQGMHAPALVGLGRLAEQGGDLAIARDYHRAAFADAEPESETWDEALEQMGRLNTELVFAQQETPESKYYTVEPGDTLTSIGIKLNTTQGLLTRANGLTDASTLHPGQRLKYTPKDFRVLVERDTRRLYLFDNQGPFKCYPAGLGKPGYETTLGKYTIGSKQKDPTWFRPDGPPVPPNDPENELGTRWMPMVPAEEGLPTDLGIHGTIAPETIGQYASRGCPRLLNESAEELYDLIVRSTPVEVVEKIDWKALGAFPWRRPS